MKYILFEDFGGHPVPIIFPNRIDHEEMREQMPYTKVLSGGYVELEQGAFRCYGEAKSIKACAGDGDAALLVGIFSEDAQ
ncbi:MAG: hypothetical protein AB7E47_05175 [Desulfovibrionaceae bacterium]